MLTHSFYLNKYSVTQLLMSPTCLCLISFYTLSLKYAKFLYCTLALCQKRNVNLLAQKLLWKWIRNWPLKLMSPTCLRAALSFADPESTKSCLTWLSFFVLMGSLRVRAAGKMMMKLTPGLQVLRKQTNIDKEGE